MSMILHLGSAGTVRFTPSVIPSAVTLLLLALLLALGLWQLDRAGQKQTLMNAFQERVELPPVALAELRQRQTLDRYRHVTAQGRYDGGRQVLLENQVRHGRPGFHVYTPFKLADGSGVLVNRGWVASDLSRERLPAVELPAPAATDRAIVVSGRLSPPANPGIKLALDTTGAIAWPQAVQHIDFQSLSEQLGYALLNMVILLDDNSPGAAPKLSRDWQFGFGEFGPERHRGYAVQWFGLALTLVIIYLVTNTQWQRKT